MRQGIHPPTIHAHLYHPMGPSVMPVPHLRHRPVVADPASPRRARLSPCRFLLEPYYN